MDLDSLLQQKVVLPIDECHLQKLNYLGAIFNSGYLCLPNNNILLICNYLDLNQPLIQKKLCNRISLIKTDENSQKIAVLAGQMLYIFAFERSSERVVELFSVNLLQKIKDLVWHPTLSDILLVSFVDKFVIYDIKNNEADPVFTQDLAHGVEYRWNKTGNVLIIILKKNWIRRNELIKFSLYRTTTEEVISYAWETDIIHKWKSFKTDALLTCKSMRNIIFIGDNDYFWAISTPNLAIPKKESFLTASKQQDLIQKKETKPLGILESLSNISSQLLIQAEHVQTEHDEISKELPRIHCIQFENTSNRLFELTSIEYDHITTSSMMDYNIQKKILAIGSKQRIDLFDCHNDNTPKLSITWEMPSPLLGLKIDANNLMVLIGQPKPSNNSSSFLSFDTTTVYTNIELWTIKLPNLVNPMTNSEIDTKNSISNSNNDNLAILSAIQNLKFFVEEQFKRVNERLDRIETTLNRNNNNVHI